MNLVFHFMGEVQLDVEIVRKGAVQEAGFTTLLLTLARQVFAPHLGKVPLVKGPVWLWQEQSFFAPEGAWALEWEIVGPDLLEGKMRSTLLATYAPSQIAALRRAPKGVSPAVRASWALCAVAQHQGLGTMEVTHG